MKDKDIKLSILKKLKEEMEEPDKNKVVSISVQKIKPIKVASNYEEGVKVLKEQKKKDKEDKGKRRSVESLDDDMFMNLLRKKGKRL